MNLSCRAVAVSGSTALQYLLNTGSLKYVKQQVKQYQTLGTKYPATYQRNKLMFVSEKEDTLRGFAHLEKILQTLEIH